MRLKNKTAVLYGGGGHVGAAVARAFAREGARVFCPGGRSNRWRWSQARSSPTAAMPTLRKLMQPIQSV